MSAAIAIDSSNSKCRYLLLSVVKNGSENSSGTMNELLARKYVAINNKNMSVIIAG